MEFLSGLRSDDLGTVLLSLHQLNETLTIGTGTIPGGVVIPQLLQRMSDTNSEVVLLACRALNTIIDIDPRTVSFIADSGAVPVLCAQLRVMTDADVAEQCLKWCVAARRATPRAFRTCRLTRRGAAQHASSGTGFPQPAAAGWRAGGFAGVP